MATMSGGGLIAAMLAAEGVDTAFGITDGTYLGLFRGMDTHHIRLVTPRHETTAAHMAGAYARLTGKLGVVIASNGPGVANVLPGVAVEQAEGNRVLLITSSRRTGITYPDRGGAYQYFDQVATIRPMAKWSESAASYDRIPELLRRALRRSYEGRPGVVHLDIPEDIMNGKFKPVEVLPPSRYRSVSGLEPGAEEVDRAADLLMGARLPVIHAGGGTIHARCFPELARVAELLHAPVTTSWSGRGALAETHPLAWPMHLIEENNEVRTAADVVLVLGSRIGETDWWGKPPHWAASDQQKLIRVDIDAESLGLNRPADLTLQADAGRFLAALARRLEGRPVPASRRPEVEQLAKSRDGAQRKLAKALEDRSTPMNSAHIADACRRGFDDDAVLIIDGGNAAVWANFYHQVRAPNTLLSTPHFGMLGAGPGQALGAAVARPNAQVYCILGDGAFGFHPQEIETAVRNDLNVVFLVVTDRQWGMVKMTQSITARPMKMVLRKSLAPNETINADLGEISYDRLAESMGAHGERVADPADLPDAIEKSVASGRCAVIHVDVDPVKHMWAPGLQNFKKMHQEPGG
jgi:acetolactate synthase-1/2/3 large subunit